MKNLMDVYILPEMKFAGINLASPKSEMESLAIDHRKIERQMTGITCLDHKTDKSIRQQTQIEDIRQGIKKSKK